MQQYADSKMARAEVQLPRRGLVVEVEACHRHARDNEPQRILERGFAAGAQMTLNVEGRHSGPPQLRCVLPSGGALRGQVGQQRVQLATGGGGVGLAYPCVELLEIKPAMDAVIAEEMHDPLALPITSPKLCVTHAPRIIRTAST